MDILNSSVVSIVQTFRQVLFQVRLEVLVRLSALKNKWLQIARCQLKMHITFDYRNQVIKVITGGVWKANCTSGVCSPVTSVQHLRAAKAQGNHSKIYLAIQSLILAIVFMKPRNKI